MCSNQARNSSDFDGRISPGVLIWASFRPGRKKSDFEGRNAGVPTWASFRPDRKERDFDERRSPGVPIWASFWPGVFGDLQVEDGRSRSAGAPIWASFWPDKKKSDFDGRSPGVPIWAFDDLQVEYRRRRSAGVPIRASVWPDRKKSVSFWPGRKVCSATYRTRTKEEEAPVRQSGRRFGPTGRCVRRPTS